MLTTLPQTIWAGDREDNHRQFLDLAVKLTRAPYGAFLRPDGRLPLIIPGEQRLSQDCWQAAREAVRSQVPLLFQGNRERPVPPILAMPLPRPDGLLEVLVLGDRQPPLTDADLNLVLLLADSSSLEADQAVPRKRSPIFLLNSIKTLLQTLKTRDYYTWRHSTRMMEFALQFARTLGRPQEELAAIKTAGLLHDLGKMGISDTILLKKGALNVKECNIMKTHPLIGARIVRPLGLKPAEMAIILHHHERWDGRGYPQGLAEGEIPFLCRLVALADTFDALTSDRPYRSRFPVEVALEEIAFHAGTQFDPELAEKFIKMIGDPAP